MHRTLRELGVARLDLLLMHWPDAWVPGSDKQPDTEVTIEQTWCVFCCMCAFDPVENVEWGPILRHSQAGRRIDCHLLVPFACMHA